MKRVRSKVQYVMKAVVVFLLQSLVLVWTTASAQQRITPSPRLPQTSPWSLEQLNQPPDYAWETALGPSRGLLYTSEPYRGRATKVFAYYASPRTLNGSAPPGTKYPGVVLVHGGGGTAFREWVELWARRGYAAIAMDLAGHRPIEGRNPHAQENRVRLEDGGPGQGDDEKFGSVSLPADQQWPYHAVAAVIRAHSLLLSFAEVDSERTAVTGISWGGYLTCIVAGLDNRFDAAVPVYGCGFLDHNSAWTDRLNRMTPAERERWVTLWDPSQYLPAVSMPILFINGTNDFAYPLDSYQKCFDLVPSAKSIRITVNMPHSHQAGWAPVEIGRFIDQYLKQEPPLPEVGVPQVTTNEVRIPCRSPQPVRSAALHWTTDSQPINRRTWETRTAHVEDGQIIVTPVPPSNAVWFVTVTDRLGAVVSSRVMWGPDTPSTGKAPE